MPLSIKDSETDALARRLAARTGESITRAVKQALRERLARVERKRSNRGLSGRLLKIGRQCAAHMSKPAHSQDHSDLFYDEQGLPK